MKLKNVWDVILKVLTHVRTHPEELLVSKIWISCFLFRLRLLARVKRKERSCTGRNGNTLQHCNAQLFGCLKNNKTKRYYDRNFHGKAVSKDKRKGLPTKTRNINPLCGSEINTSKWRDGNTLQHGISQLLEVLKTTRQRTLHAKSWENNIVWGKKGA